MDLNKRVVLEPNLSDSTNGLIKELNDTLMQVYSGTKIENILEALYDSSIDIHNVGDERVFKSINTQMCDAINTVNAAIPNCELYGLKIDKNNSDPSTRITYISTCDNANFTPASANGTSLNLHEWADAWFVKGNYPCLLSFDGKTETRLNPNDYTKTTSGAASNVTSTSAAGNFMAVIPLVWVKFDEDNNYEYIYISNIKYDDDFQAIAHTRSDGVIVSKIYMSMFRGYVTGNKMRSIANVIPSGNNTAQQEVTYAQANNPSGIAATTRLQSSGGTCDGWYTWTWGQYMLLTALLLIMGRSDDSQTTFGSGVCNTYVGNSSVAYGMQKGGAVHSDYTATYGTTTNTLGQFWGTNDYKNHVKVFHIEDMWGNQAKRIAGLLSNSGQLWAKFHGPYVVSTTATTQDAIATELASEGYTHVKSIAASDGFSAGDYIDITSDQDMYATHTKTTKFGRFPISAEAINGVGGSASTYTCDCMYWYTIPFGYAMNCSTYLCPDKERSLGFSSIDIRISPERYNKGFNTGASISYI